MEKHRIRPQSWRRDYESLAEAILKEEPGITREALAEELAIPFDMINEIVERIRPHVAARAAGPATPVRQQNISGRFVR
jgi:hypothetical protein